MTVSCTAGAVTTVKSTLGFLEVGVVLISSVEVVVGAIVALTSVVAASKLVLDVRELDEVLSLTCETLVVARLAGNVSNKLLEVDLDPGMVTEGVIEVVSDEDSTGLFEVVSDVTDVVSVDNVEEEVVTDVVVDNVEEDAVAKAAVGNFGEDVVTKLVDNVVGTSVDDVKKDDLAGLLGVSACNKSFIS